jgi:CheY-like chemotaxis protein
MAAGSCVKRSILLVEDEAIIALAEKSGLEARGFSVRHVMSGEEAVRVALGPDAPELVLMDLDLGRGIDGTAAPGTGWPYGGRAQFSV